MDSESPPFLAALEELIRRRAELRAEIDAIDAQLKRAAALIGGRDLSGSTEPEAPKVDRRRAGTMMEFILDLLDKADRGLSRKELKGLLVGHSEFGPKVRANENGFYNGVARLVRKGEVVEVDGLLYAEGSAPASKDRGLFGPIVGARPSNEIREAF